MVEILPVDDLPIIGGIIQDIFVEEDFNHNQSPNWNLHLNDVFFDIDGDLEYEVSFSDPAGSEKETSYSKSPSISKKTSLR